MVEINAELIVNAGEWWKKDIVQVYNEFTQSGGNPDVSDAYLINGQPGDLYPCSKSGSESIIFHFLLV